MFVTIYTKRRKGDRKGGAEKIFLACLFWERSLSSGSPLESDVRSTIPYLCVITRIVSRREVPLIVGPFLFRCPIILRRVV